jgi:hypothetical protein
VLAGSDLLEALHRPASRLCFTVHDSETAVAGTVSADDLASDLRKRKGPRRPMDVGRGATLGTKSVLQSYAPVWCGVNAAGSRGTAEVYA